MSTTEIANVRIDEIAEIGVDAARIADRIEGLASRLEDIAARLDEDAAARIVEGFFRLAHRIDQFAAALDDIDDEVAAFDGTSPVPS